MYRRIICAKGLKGTSYSTVNKRVRDLEQKGYIKKAQTKERTGGITNYYQLRPKAYLATFFDATSIDELLEQTSDETALTTLATLIGTQKS